MSHPRRLWVRFRRVGPERREAYLGAVREAGVAASGNGAHLWAFEVDGDEGQYVEFLEGPDDEELARVDGSTAASLAAAAGSPEAGVAEAAAEVWVGAQGLKCTEARIPAGPPDGAAD
ncbi:MAG: hypothetical protein Q8W46_05705 [Candidatus Palauibacterales bacterium]|nr:hypothetical protein [Candidatus Palauibacterales bacterium]